MREAMRTPTPLVAQPPLALERFNLDAHPDGLLMRLCGTLQRLRGQLDALERCIEAIPPLTAEGRKMKALSL